MSSNKVIRITFIISLTGHLFLLGMPGFNLPAFQEKNSQEITVRIEIEKPPLLPKIDVMGEEKKLKEIIVEESKQPEPEPELQPEEIVTEEPPKKQVEEKVEVIDPAQEAMLRYQDKVKQRIEEVRKYPYWAKKQGIEGATYLKFSVLSNGSSQDIRIIRSSGFEILDEEAIATVKRANPFPSIPKEIDASFVQMEVSIVFKLN